MAKARKSTKAANLRIRWNRIANGMSQAGPNSPVFILCGTKIVKLSRAEYAKLEEEAQALSDFSGELVLPEHIVQSKNRKHRK